MAENTGEKGEKGLAKMISRRMARTKVKVMQKIGNADRTTDSDFDRTVESFTEQQAVANHLLKEFKNYTAQVKAMSMSSQAMYQAIKHSCESLWPEHEDDKFETASENLATSWNEYLLKLNDHVLPILVNYVNKFKDVKAKVAKRGRKLTDFDSSRNNVHSLENAKKRDEVKIVKAQEELNAAKSVYETIHTELCEELPALYRSRIPSLCSYFGALFDAEALFETESSEIKRSLGRLVDSKSGAEGPVSSHAMTVHSHISPPRPPVINRGISNQSNQGKQKTLSEIDDEQNEYITLISEVGRLDSETSDLEDLRTERVSHEHVDHAIVASVSAGGDRRSSADSKAKSDREINQLPEAKLSVSSSESTESVPKKLHHSDDHLESPLVSSEGSIDSKEKRSTEDQKSSAEGIGGGGGGGGGAAAESEKLSLDENEEHSSETGKQKLVELVEAVVDHISSSSDEENAVASPPATETAHKYLFQVLAIHSYKAEDADELSFEKGDVIGILPLEDSSDEQDEGWLLGVRCSTGEKGMFPLNFTNRL